MSELVPPELRGSRPRRTRQMPVRVMTRYPSLTRLRFAELVMSSRPKEAEQQQMPDLTLNHPPTKDNKPP